MTCPSTHSPQLCRLSLLVPLFECQSPGGLVAEHDPASCTTPNRPPSDQKHECQNGNRVRTARVEVGTGCMVGWGRVHRRRHHEYVLVDDDADVRAVRSVESSEHIAIPETGRGTEGVQRSDGEGRPRSRAHIGWASPGAVFGDEVVMWPRGLWHME